MSALPEAFFVPDGPDRYAPTEATTSPWDFDAQHGGPPLALAAHLMDAHAGAGMRLARITADFLGAIPKQPMNVEVAVLRPGRRVQLAQATLSVDGRAAVIARGWYIATSGGVPEPSAPDVPETVPGEQPQYYFAGLRDWGYGEAIDWRFVSGGFAEPGPCAVWTRVRLPLVAGVPLSGPARALIVADAANGLSGDLPLADYWFIPPGVSVAMLRAPVGEWVRLAATTVRGADGLGVTTGQLADPGGYLGEVVQPLMVAAR